MWLNKPFKYSLFIVNKVNFRKGRFLYWYFNSFFDIIMQMEFDTPKEFYKDEMERLQHGKEREGNKFDKVMLIFVPGTLVLFVPLIIDMVKSGSDNMFWLAVCSLVSLIISSSLIIINYFLVDRDFKIRFLALEDFKNKILAGEASVKYDPKNKWQKAVVPINVTTFILWLLGVIFMLVFFYYNINLINNMSDKQKNKEQFGKSYANPSTSYSSSDSKPSTTTPSEKPQQEQPKEVKK